MTVLGFVMNAVGRIVLFSVLALFIVGVLPIRILVSILTRKLWAEAPLVYRDFRDAREIMRDLLL